MLVGVLFFSFMVGALSEMDTETRSYQMQQSSYVMEEFGERTGLSRTIKVEVRQSIKRTIQKAILTEKEREMFFDSLPMNLQKSLGASISSDVITRIPFFKDVDQTFLCSIIAQLKPLSTNRGDKLFYKGEFPSSMYIILDGAVDCLYGERDLTFKKFVAGAYIGEIEIFFSKLRRFTARCKTGCSLLVIDRENLM